MSFGTSDALIPLAENRRVVIKRIGKVAAKKRPVLLHNSRIKKGNF